MISNCPRCGEPVRVPEVDDQSEVRCPWCRETFVLRDVFATLPPILEVVSQIGSPTDYPIETSQAAQSASPSVDGGGYEPADIEGADVEAEEDFEFDAIAPTEFEGGRPGFVEFGSGERLTHSRRSPDTAKRATSRSLSRSGDRAARSRRKRDSPFVGFLKMAGGGVAGLLLAMLILQYMRRLPDMGFWPFRGPSLSMFEGLGGKKSSNETVKSTDSSNAIPKLDVPNFDVPAMIESETSADKMVTTEPGTVDFASLEKVNSQLLLEALDAAEDTLSNHLATKDSGDLPRVASQLFDQLAIVGERFAAVDSIPAEAILRLDALLSSLSGDKGLLKEALMYSFPKTEVAVASFRTQELSDSQPPGAAVLGKPFEEAGVWYLGQKQSPIDGLPLVLSESQIENISAQPILVIGVIEDNAIVVSYLKEL
jgi:hypothetical protein